MSIHKNLLIFLLVQLFLIPPVFTQEVGIGEWRDHLPYKSTVSVTASKENVYCATPYSIFYYNKNENSVSRFTRITGLSDIGIVRVGFNQDYNTLLVAYENTNIDLVKGNMIINMRDIINSDAITPEEKIINNVMFIDNLAYLSCGFGIVVLDIDKEEIADTYYIGPNGAHIDVHDLTHNDTSFFAATEMGIFSAYLDGPNLAYFGSWSRDESLPDPSAYYSYIEFFNGKLFTCKASEEYGNDTILYHENSTWNYNSEFSNEDVYGLKNYNNELYVIHAYFINAYDTNLERTLNIWTYDYKAGPSPRDLIVDNNIIWIADRQNGLVKRVSSNDYTFIYPNGPNTPDVFSMSAAGNNVSVVAGGRNLSWNNIWKRGNISSFTDNEWNTVDETIEPALDTLLDMVCVAINPFKHSQVFAGSWFRGMVELNNLAIENVYSPENSGLNYTTNQGAPVCRVGGLAFDRSGYLWVTSSHANEILSVRIPDGTPLGEWHSYDLGSFSGSQDVGNLIIDSYNQKWILIRTEHSLIVFNDNGTVTDGGDDQVKVLTSAAGNGNIPGNKVFSIAEDNDGEVWIGTDEGVAVFYSPENVFSNYNFDAQRILIPRNDGTGLADILLEFETVTAIAVDGANNKWIGTDRSGVFHLSPDGQKQFNHFTEQNSPLFSNNITSIVISEEGEVFIGTAKGIISYRSSATPGGTTNSDVYAYPNPVESGYTGPIAIKGLVSNADFKITDISGNLIFSGRAEGGQAIWNGNNFNGRRAQSGVYLVFVSNDDGSEKLVTKILFIN
ncbi:MAG: T9SS type A sorting domain-containing protein [Bacteroidales bacterium]|nr:T9SS type A sorting domain-containing protein [Bacteroidales bacterium]